jgi:hypothetical protein
MAVPFSMMKSAMRRGAKFSELRSIWPETTVILRGVVAEEQPAIDRAQDLVAMGLIFERWLSED